MLDRYTLAYTPEFYSHFKTCNKLPSFPNNTNVSVGDIEPIIIRQEGLTLAWVMKWGLIPFWAKKRGVSRHLFNVKAESLTKLGFRQSLKTKRCLVPANGFYFGNKFFDVEYRPLFSFAGIYDLWEEPVSGHQIYSYAIITTKSNSIFKPFSDYMPIILSHQNESLWLDSKTPVSQLEKLLNLSSKISL
jgi:putative SOS response-associated peptidase YedK